MAGAIRVLLADDDASYRSALSALLDGDDRFEVAAGAGDGTGLARLVAEVEADLVVLDVRMPGGGADAALELRDSPTAVVALTVDVSPLTVAALVRAGVRGYFVKGRIDPNFPELLVRCVAGEVLLCVPTAAHALELVLTTAALSPDPEHPPPRRPAPPPAATA